MEEVSEALSRLDSCRISFTSWIIRLASPWIFWAKPGTSSGLAMPVSISSAYPEMLVSGVLSSWLTLAVKSCRIFSLFSRRMRSAWMLSAKGISSLYGTLS